MNYPEAFKYISKKFKTNDFLIAGGACYRAFCGEKYHDSDSDIDVFISKSCFFARYSNTEHLVKQKEKKHYGGISESWIFFDTFLHKNIEYIVIDDANFNKEKIVDDFDLNCSRYWWNSAKECIENDDPFPTEIAVLKMKDGYTFQRIFERVSKYRQIVSKPVVFRIQPMVIIKKEDTTKPKPSIMDDY